MSDVSEAEVEELGKVLEPILKFNEWWQHTELLRAALTAARKVWKEPDYHKMWEDNAAATATAMNRALVAEEKLAELEIRQPSPSVGEIDYGELVAGLRKPVMLHSNAEQTNAERRSAAESIEGLVRLIALTAAPEKVVRRVVVVANDYTYEGWLVSEFTKRGGAVRVVVEDDNGRLFIHNLTQIKEIVK